MAKLPKITNIEQLRDHALSLLEQLADQEIEINQAAASGKIIEGVISTLKTQMEYNRMIGENKPIEFLGDYKKGRLLDGDNTKKLTQK